MTLYKRRDSNHTPIQAGLEAVTTVLDVGFVHALGCDLIALDKQGRVRFVEIKMPGKSASLTKSELKLRAKFPGWFVVAETLNEALAALGFRSLADKAAP